MWLFQMLLFDKWKKNMKKSQTYIVNANLFYSFCFQQFFYSRISFQFSCFIYFFHHLFFFIYSLFFLKKNLLIVTPFIWCCFSASQNAVKYNWGEKRKTAVYSFLSFRAWFKKKTRVVYSQLTMEFSFLGNRSFKILQSRWWWHKSDELSSQECWTLMFPADIFLSISFSVVLLLNPLARRLGFLYWIGTRVRRERQGLTSWIGLKHGGVPQVSLSQCKTTYATCSYRFAISTWIGVVGTNGIMPRFILEHTPRAVSHHRYKLYSQLGRRYGKKARLNYGFGFGAGVHTISNTPAGFEPH